MKQLTFPHGLTARRRRTPSIPADFQASAHHKLRKVNLATMLAGVLTLGFITVLTLTRMVTMAVHPEGFTSALTPYESIQPGVRLADIRPFTCGPHYLVHETREEQCDLNQVGAKLRRVTLTLQGGKVSNVTFIGSGILVGDLVQLWGRPNTISDKNGSFTLHWDSGIRAITPGRNGFSYHLPIKIVMLT